MKPRAAVLSLALHFVGALALFLMASFVATRTSPPDQARVIMPLRLTRFVTKLAGGGGDRSKTPPLKGRAPEVRSQRPFVMPIQVINQNPQLVVEQALLTAPDFNIDAPNLGDPLGMTNGRSRGPGGPTGFGEAPGNSIGNIGGSGFHEGAKPKVKLTRGPQVLYQVEPEYSEEARKVRFQGTVILAIDVDENGRPSNIRVVRSIGLGLDERAIAAVEKWKFRPALAGDHAVVAPAMVEVTFHLL